MTLSFIFRNVSLRDDLVEDVLRILLMILQYLPQVLVIVMNLWKMCFHELLHISESTTSAYLGHAFAEGVTVSCQIYVMIDLISSASLSR
jgi:hypothetical protein